MPKKKSIEISQYPMMSAEKETHIRELHMEGYTPREMAEEMGSNSKMVLLWHKMLKLEPNKGSLQESWGFTPGAKNQNKARFDQPDQQKAGKEIIDNTMPARPASTFCISSLF